jgi:DNA segregation ATPase FtsK/SpoIIIE, S-DNA-T family
LSTAEPQISRFERIGSEAGTIAIVLLMVLWLVALLTFSAQDHAWSTTGSALYPTISNRVGKFGALLSDLSFYAFGLSVYWVPLAVLFYAALRLRVVSDEARGWKDYAYPIAGLIVLVMASSGLEALRFTSLSRVLTVMGAGGYVGGVIAQFLGQWVGVAIATAALVVLSGIALSVTFGFSWLSVAERIGALWDRLLERKRQKEEVEEDIQVGAQMAAAREERVEEQIKQFEEHEPIRIEVPKVEIKKSERVIRERQAQLFPEMPDSELPTVSLLDPPPTSFERPAPEALEYTSRLIEKKCGEYGVSVRVHAAYPGPVITRYEIEPATGVKGSQIMNLSRDLARALSVTAIRVVETIPGTSYMGLEIPNAKRQVVKLSEIIGSRDYNDAPSKITMVLGKDIAGRPSIIDLAKCPHLLVAGTTGSGKSVAINAMILSLVYRAQPADVRLIMIDPKMLELSIYEGIPHLLAPVVTDMKQAGHALNWCVAEMERRYKLMSAVGVRNLAGYNSKVIDARAKGQPLKHPFSLTPDNPEPLDNLPLIVVIIDELADLMMVTGKKVEEQIARIAQKARAAGIHLILATQRPSVDVITGLIKANVPSRISFQVSSKIDSRTILDQMGAESLLGMGDMLYLAPGTGLPARMHGAFVSDAEVHRVVEFLKSKGEPQYIEGILEGPDLGDASNVSGDGAGGAGGESDPLYDQAVDVVLKNRRASISLVQRHLRIGYNRAARLLEDMERAGLVSAMTSNGNREIITPKKDGE